MAQNEKELLAEIAVLKAKLGESELKRSEAEAMALTAAQASPYIGVSEEQPTGKTVVVNVCLNPAERDVKKLKFKGIEYPTYFYTIQLPAGAGLCLTTNGAEFYHGQTYEFDPMGLVDMKSRVARCWDHEKSIHGDNENAYRRPSQQSFMSAAALARRPH